jgi:hypothetical protein
MFTLETLQEKFNTLYKITGLEYIDQVEEYSNRNYMGPYLEL